MSLPSSPFSTLRRATRVLWLVLFAIVLQPLALARSPTARWVQLPYCKIAAGQAGAASGAAEPAAHRVPQRPRSVVLLLNPAAALTAAGTQPAPPGRSTLVAAPAIPAVQRLRHIAAAPPLHGTPPPSPQQPRAPPLFS